jgi:CBS domain-containing protein
MTRVGPENAVAPDTDVLRALDLMQRSGRSRLMVVEGETLVGIVALRDLLAFVSARLEAEQARAHAGRPSIQPRWPSEKPA